MLLLIPGSILAVLLQLCHAFPSQQKKLFTGHKVLNFIPATKYNYGKVLQMELQYELDVWKNPKHTADNMTIRVPPEHMDNFLQELNHLDIVPEIIIEDVEQLLADVEHKDRLKRDAISSEVPDFFMNWRDYDAMVQYIQDAATHANARGDTIVEIKEIGTSHEGREITLVKISSSTSTSKKPAIFIDGGIHAREWIAPMCVVYMIHQLTYNTDAYIGELLDRYDFYLVPILNPDGLVYSQVSDRFWRKNRRTNSGTWSSCNGVDLNRNFAFHWHQGGASSNPCSDTYAGPSAESEPEINAVADFLRTHRGEIEAYFSIHSYGQLWMYPWAYKSVELADRTELHERALKGVAKMKELGYGHVTYMVGGLANTLYIASGTSIDFAKAEAGIKYSYAIELPDEGQYGFALPASKIEPACEGFWQGFVAFAQAPASASSASTPGPTVAPTLRTTAAPTEPNVGPPHEKIMIIN